jgi:alpha-L-arabinofuranosidase
MNGYRYPTVLALLLLALTVAPASFAGEASIAVQADQVVGPVSRLLTGACIEDVNHEIYGGLYSQMIFGESFQEPAPVPAIHGFKPYGGRWLVSDGVLSFDGLDGPKLVSDHEAFRNGAVGVDLLFADRQGENAGLIVRVNQPGLGADKFTGYEVSLDAARQKLRLGRHRHNFKLIQDVPCAVAVGRWLALEVRLAGPVIEVLVDGKLALRHDDGAEALPAGAVGVRTWHRAAGCRNLWVKTGAQVEPLDFAMTAAAPEISGQWRAVQRGTAQGRFALAAAQPFAGAQSQLVQFDTGEGAWGVENQGLNHWGLNFVAGQVYEGYLWARAEKPTTLFAALESRDGARVYAGTPLAVAGPAWQRIDFRLTPDAADPAGRFALTLRQPGAVRLGHVFLQPGEWGRFKGLPVRRDVADALVAQGITVLRYGGSMVNHAGYRWKQMVGPRDRRPPYPGTWYRYASNGWGILDFMDFCEAAGFEYIPDFNINETPQDMADFIAYAKGAADSKWGRRRVADGHPAPYTLHYIQLGNEERVDAQYFARFKPIAEAIWAQDPDVILVVGDFFYTRPIVDPYQVAGGSVTTLAGQKQILDLAKAHDREVWFDVHVGTERPVQPNASLEGMFSFCTALDKLADGARHKVVVFELNAGNHALKRALANALATHAIERDGRIPIVCSANGLQPDGQNDNGWDQGLLFLNPARVWLQPPGYVTRMFARPYLPQRVACQVTGAEHPLDALARRSADGRTLVLQVVNPADETVTAQVHLAGFVPTKPVAQVTELSGPLDAVNTADQPEAIVPQQRDWPHANGRYAFPPHSFTVLRFE